MRRAWGAGDACVVGTVGRMADIKNHALLIRAAAPLLKRGVMLVIAGDGPERERCERLARELDVDGAVRFLGMVSDVPRMLSGLDMFVLSSKTEGLPMVLAEAMGASLPVVATAVGGVPGVVLEGETGFLVAPQDEAALGERIGALFRDPVLARTLGERAQVVASERYALDRMVRDYLDVYTDAYARWR
jgi:glycosyltransferase involved in cell wall biosynthesis